MKQSVEKLGPSGILISPEAFEGVTQRAVERLSHARYVTSPATELPADEVGILTEGGFDLSPLEFTGHHPVAKSATNDLAHIETRSTGRGDDGPDESATYRHFPGSSEK